MALRDVQDEILDELKQLNQNLRKRGIASEATTETPTTAETPDYFTTGPAGISLDDPATFTEVDFGFVAQTVNLRFDDNIDVAFANPHVNSGKLIPFAGEESPVSLGGFAGVDGPKLWIRKAQTATTDVEAHVIAFQ